MEPWKLKMDAWRLKIEDWRVYRPVVADWHRLDMGSRTRNRIEVKSWIRNPDGNIKSVPFNYWHVRHNSSMAFIIPLRSVFLGEFVLVLSCMNSGFYWFIGPAPTWFSSLTLKLYLPVYRNLLESR
jgi:hypothetical protein